jgi:histidyl-tRNA synthetase
MGVWAAVEATARRVFGLYGYGEIRTPILEPLELFVRSVGESTDIVGKEMYSLTDRKGRKLCLRPESTASVARAFVEHGMRDWPQPVRLYYMGPQFRCERPQKGRYRQFYQIGAELLGDPGPVTDAELLLMLLELFGELGFKDLTILLNTLGDEASRLAYREALLHFFLPLRDRLGEDSQRRLETNPLRILDTKSKVEQELLEDAPELSHCLTRDSREHFQELCEQLDRFGVSYRLEQKLVRGLDYYTSTVFEIVSGELGAQDALVGGGRYDRLIADLGGPVVPAIGFAIGQDRLIDVLPDDFRIQAEPASAGVVVPAGAVSAVEALALAQELRSQGLAVLPELSGRSLKATLKRASKMGSPWVLILGDDELEGGLVTLRDLSRGEQQKVARNEVVAALAALEDEA